MRDYIIKIINYGDEKFCNIGPWKDEWEEAVLERRHLKFFLNEEQDSPIEDGQANQVSRLLNFIFLCHWKCGEIS